MSISRAAATDNGLGLHSTNQHHVSSWLVIPVMLLAKPSLAKSLLYKIDDF